MFDELVFIEMILSRLVLATEGCKVGSERRRDDDRARESSRREDESAKTK